MHKDNATFFDIINQCKLISYDILLKLITTVLIQMTWAYEPKSPMLMYFALNRMSLDPRLRDPCIGA